MSDADRAKWDARYAAGSYADRTHPTAWLAARLDELPRGKALDIACGAGRNALYLAAAGYQVDAIDISSVGLARGAGFDHAGGVNWIEADLDCMPLPDTEYDLIVWIRYVNRPLFTTLESRLKPGGYLLVEQHLRVEQQVIGPSDPAYRLAPNELLKTAAELRVLAYQEGLATDPDGRQVALARLLACRPPALFDISATRSA